MSFQFKDTNQNDGNYDMKTMTKDANDSGISNEDATNLESDSFEEEDLKSGSKGRESLKQKMLQKIESKEPFFSLEFFPPKTNAGQFKAVERFQRMAIGKPLFVDITWKPTETGNDDVYVSITTSFSPSPVLGVCFSVSLQLFFFFFSLLHTFTLLIITHSSRDTQTRGSH